MKTCTKCKAGKSAAEFSKDKSRKDGLYPHCKECVRVAHAIWYAANPGKNSLRCKKWREDHPVQARQTNRRLSASQREQRPQYNRARVQQFKLDNPSWCAENNARRRAAKLQATPAWADQDKIKFIYAQAAELGMHVDHIVPLKSKLVCGLHNEFNLQVLTGVDNLKKGNRHWPDMPLAAEGGFGRRLADTK